jgi:hypothetical protein
LRNTWPPARSYVTTARNAAVADVGQEVDPVAHGFLKQRLTDSAVANPEGGVKANLTTESPVK